MNEWVGRTNRSGRVFTRGFAVILLPLFLVSCSNTKKPEPQSSASTDVLSLSNSSHEVIGGVPLQRPQLKIGDPKAEAIVSGSHAVGQNYASLPGSVPSGNVISNQTKFSSKKYGVAGSPRVTTGIKVRKGGGRYQVGKPYTIRGKRYVPREDPNYKSTGLASWYGPNFHGRLTANGEVYDQFALSAAHPTMPLPSYARVTNLENGSSVIVRVNDRGPFAHKRVIDLSSRAAELLGYTKKGVAKVTVEYVGKARMDGLDESYLVASYSPGSLNRSTLVASAETSVPSQAVNPSRTPVLPPSRQTLDAFDNDGFSTANPVQNISALQPPVPSSLINGFADEKKVPAANAINLIARDKAVQSNLLGMQDLKRVTVSDIQSRASLFVWSERLSQFGPVSIDDQAPENGYSLSVVIAVEDVDRVKALFN